MKVYTNKLTSYDPSLTLNSKSITSQSFTNYFSLQNVKLYYDEFYFMAPYI